MRAMPDRWLPYSCVGSIIEGTRLICFKVPLKEVVLQESIKNGVKIDKMWSVKSVIEAIPKLRFVIDLTNTDRYYNPHMFKAAGVKHVKIALPGRILPPEGIVTRFCDTVDKLMAEGDEDSVIGVHCTHGLNRTGYMVCRYLRDRMNVPVETAIEIFEAARGHKIERENYLAILRGEIPPPPDFSDGPTINQVGTKNVQSHKEMHPNRHPERQQYQHNRYDRNDQYSKYRHVNHQRFGYQGPGSSHQWADKMHKFEDRHRNNRNTSYDNARKTKKEGKKKRKEEIDYKYEY